MMHLPKKTYSRKNKANKKRGSKRNTETQPEKSDFDVDQTLPDDIWKDSFDRLKDLESVPTPRNPRNRLSKECVKRFHSFVSTPKAASKELEECPIPFSPIQNRRYFLSNDYYDNRGNPLRIFEYSSEIGQGLLQSVSVLNDTDLSHQWDKTKSNFLIQGSETKADKLRDKTNLISSNSPKTTKSLTRKENAKTCSKVTLTKKRGCKSESSKLCCRAEPEQISLRDQKHTEKENCNFAAHSSQLKESTENRTQNIFASETSRKSKQKRQLKKRQQSQRGSLDNLSKETTPIFAKRSKQTITAELDLIAISEPLCSEQLMKQSLELNQTSLSSATSIRKSKGKNNLKSKLNSLENLFNLSNGGATCNKSRTKKSRQSISQTTGDVLESEQLPLKNITNSKSGEIENIETSNDDDSEIPSSRKKPLKNSELEIMRNVEVVVDNSIIASSQRTPFQTRNSRKSDTVNAKKPRTQRKSRKANRYLPLPFVEIISGKKLGQETIVITDDSFPTGVLEEPRRNLNRKTTENKQKSKIEKRNSKKPHDLELCDQIKTEDEILSNCKEVEISLRKIDLEKEARKTPSVDDSSSNQSLVSHGNLSDRISFVTRRTRDRQSHQRKRSDAVLSSAGEIVDIGRENTCLEISTSFQSRTNNAKWDISHSFNKEAARISNNLNDSLNGSINKEELLNAINWKTMMAERSKEHHTVQKEGPQAKLSIVLQPGKWRKSLNMWRRLNTTCKDKINDSEILPAQNSRFTNQTLMRTFCDEPFNSSLAKATDQRASTRLGNSSCIYQRKAIIDYEKSALVLKRSTDLYDVKESVLEDCCDTEDLDESALLLEPTDDESPNQSTLPHLTSVSKQNVCTSLRRSQTVCYKDLYSPRDTEYSNETSNERAQRYQHQLSVPLPLYRQPSISRRRRTSIVGLPVPGIGGPICEDDLFTEFVRLSTYEVSLCAQLDAKDIVLRRCGQSEPLNFADEYSEKALHQCRKIGEGVYGEVFMNKNFTGETVVLKIIPIEGCVEINGESQKRFDEILSEIVIAMELSRLRNDKKYTTSGFVEVKKVRCVKGRYPDHLLELWELFRENHGTENDHPEIFLEDQLYIVLELANGGQDLEAFTFQNALQSYSAFVQVALTIAAAERKFQFEHRDLHWGNILLAPTEEKELSFRIAGKEINIPTHGVKATIIDYTLSRMVFDGCCLYNDLSNDNELFSASGDYQFDIYRFMKKRLEDQWERFEPYTNVLWLHYAIDKMISGARYRCSKSKKHRAAIHDMMQLRDEMLDFKSASDYIECLN